MRNMSFMLTTMQMCRRTKTVTRRLGWKFLKANDVLMACVKCQGLKKHEGIATIHPIRIVRTNWQPLHNITRRDVVREGFPDMTPQGFVDMFCKEMKCKPTTLVNRIEFKHITDQEATS